MTAKLLPLFPPHDIYVEVFGGGASMLFAKPLSTIEVYNDIDGVLVNFFRVIRDPNQFPIFQRNVELTMYSRQEYEDCRATWRTQTDPVERAYRWFVMQRQSFSGVSHSWSFAVTSSVRGVSSAVNGWLSSIDHLSDVHRRLRTVQIEQMDWHQCFTTYDTHDTFFYCDPPYVLDTRSGGKKYDNEMTNDDHRELVDRLLSLEGQVILSGYPHTIYDPLKEAGWDYKQWNVSASCAGRTRSTPLRGEGSSTALFPRIEAVWMKRHRKRQLSLFE